MKVIAPATLIAFTLFASQQQVAFAAINFDVGGMVTSGYDDNVTMVSDDRISDMVTHVGLGGALTRETKTSLLKLKAGVMQNIFTKNTSFNNLEEHMRLDYAKDLNPYERIKVQDAFAHAEDPRSLEEAFGRVNGRYSTYRNNAGFIYERDLTQEWGTAARYNQSNYIVSHNALSDSAEYNPGFSVTHNFSSQAQAAVNYDYRYRTWDPGPRANTHTPSVGWQQYLTPVWRLNLLGGMDFIDGFGQRYIKPRWGAGLTHDLDKKTEAALTYSRQYETSPYVQDVFDNWRVNLTISRQITSRTTLEIGAFHGEGRFVITGIKDKLNGVNTGIRYAVTRYVDFTVNHTYQDDTFYQKQTIFAGFTLKF